MKRFLALSMIASLAITSCAGPLAAVHKPKVPASMPGEDTEPGDEYFAVIPPDRCEPQLDGLFMSWDAAKAFLVDKREIRARHKLEMIDCQEALGTSEVKLEQSQKQVEALTDGQTSFLATWGLPLGLALGLIGGAVAVGAAYGAKK